MEMYLEDKGLVDVSQVKDFALTLTASFSDDISKAKALYHFVRDQISHSADINENLVTRSASEVLKYRHGICFAKSILLAALCRAVGIPAGFGYQKLILDDEKFPWLVLHGYVFVYLESKWIKLDPRGNKEGVNAEFSLDDPKMAFEVRSELGEEDDNVIHAYPVDTVVDCLIKNKTRNDLWGNLPSEF
ncbi:MAG TPA: transglutaminase-like domain-containing protein [Spirochaetota bacterium]|nr:transglutaminase-like domain-containing protein [Spirochaetota bacterium]HQO21741.1 transglutaminase-like domain-containing protein [Spirochaetota bacterium]HQQ22702.1 transglutaminase-like domain-containing protein [Spirochaetota bacterium]